MVPPEAATFLNPLSAGVINFDSTPSAKTAYAG